MRTESRRKKWLSRQHRDTLFNISMSPWDSQIVSFELVENIHIGSQLEFQIQNQQSEDRKPFRDILSSLRQRNSHLPFLNPLGPMRTFSSSCSMRSNPSIFTWFGFEFEFDVAFTAFNSNSNSNSNDTSTTNDSPVQSHLESIQSHFISQKLHDVCWCECIICSKQLKMVQHYEFFRHSAFNISHKGNFTALLDIGRTKSSCFEFSHLQNVDQWYWKLEIMLSSH
jgi:hypothetical protein